MKRKDNHREAAAISRQDIWEAFEGRCFYCACPILFEGRTFDRRDWLMVSNSTFAKEHDVPLSRGGADTQDNWLPSCRRCNSEKGQRTRREFGLLKAFRSGDLNFSFPFEADKPARDWLCCHSPAHERALLAHNVAALA